MITNTIEKVNEKLNLENDSESIESKNNTKEKKSLLHKFFFSDFN